MKTEIEITIELFDNGITWTWEKFDTDQLDKYVIKDDELHEAIGKEIWSDIQSVMDGCATNKVIMDVTYRSGDEDE